MAKKFRGPELIREIDNALDKGLRRFLILTQGKLSKASPVDSGRAALPRAPLRGAARAPLLGVGRTLGVPAMVAGWRHLVPP